VRRPYLTCERHCRYYDHCTPTLRLWEEYRQAHGRMCPLEAAVQDLACPHFTPGKRVTELPTMEVVRTP
jgi:hypothetical protein